MATLARLSSLDQFRGYTVLGMLLVNYFGNYAVCPQLLRHSHDHCSYADTIMPQFLFAVGFALRLSFGRRMQTQGSASAYGRMVRRLLGLALVALVVYSVKPPAASWDELKELGFWGAIKEPLKRQWFQTLLQIAVTSLWLLPVVHCRMPIRVAWMFLSLIAHIGLSAWFNFSWVNSPPVGIDGGPLAFLSWTIPAITGTLACDIFVRPVEDGLKFRRAASIALGAASLMGIGYFLSCGTRFYDLNDEPPRGERSAHPSSFASERSASAQKLAIDAVWPTQQRLQAKRARSDSWADWLAEPPMIKPPTAQQRQWNYWMMSQRAGSVSYTLFAAGFSLAVFSAFHWFCDVLAYRSKLLGTFGTNALAAYVWHELVSSAVQPFFPKDSPLWFALIGLGLFFLITWLMVRWLEKQEIFLRV